MKNQISICAVMLLLGTGYAIGGTSVIAGSSGISPPLFMNYSFWIIGPDEERAFPFTVTSGGPYCVEAIEVAVFTFQLYGDTSVNFTINTDDAGLPGQSIAFFELESLTMTQQVLTLPATEETILDSGVRYWIVGAAPVAYINWSLDKTARGTSSYRVDKGEWAVIPYSNVSAFAILGSPVPEPATLLLFGLGAAVLRRKR